MSARSTGRAAGTVTCGGAGAAVAESTPSTPEISSVTARWQWAQVMPVTVKVVEPMKVRGVLDSMGTPLAGWWCAASYEGGAGGGVSHRGNRRVVRRIPAGISAGISDIGGLGGPD